METDNEMEFELHFSEAIGTEGEGNEKEGIGLYRYFPVGKRCITADFGRGVHCRRSGSEGSE